jgi:hypothetical protein
VALRETSEGADAAAVAVAPTQGRGCSSSAVAAGPSTAPAGYQKCASSSSVESDPTDPVVPPEPESIAALFSVPGTPKVPAKPRSKPTLFAVGATARAGPPVKKPPRRSSLAKRPKFLKNVHVLDAVPALAALQRKRKSYWNWMTNSHDEETVGARRQRKQSSNFLSERIPSERSWTQALWDLLFEGQW